MRWYPLLLMVGCLIGLPTIAAAAETEQPADSPIGKKIENFRLQDYRGQWHALDDFSDKKVVVVAFLGIECPLVRVYAPRLVELAAEFEQQGVAFIGINPNRQDSIVEMGHFARNNDIAFPLLKDVGNVIADKFGAIRVPEMFVLDEDRVVRIGAAWTSNTAFSTASAINAASSTAATWPRPLAKCWPASR